MQSIGRATRRLDWEDVTTGRTVYVADRHPDGELVARVLRSPHPHAKILTLDTTRAERMPGVRAIVTADDLVPGIHYHHHGGELADRPPLARDRVRYVGEEIAAVAATSREAADAALDAIEVVFDPLPAVTSVEAACAPKASTIHDHRPDNVARSTRRRYGATSVAADALSVKGTYRYCRQAHVPMETNRTTARWDPDREILELWTSTQSPLFIRKDVASCLGLDLAQVRLREVAVGGSFGSKSKISEHEVPVAALARKVPWTPVTIVLDRAEEFAATKPRHGTTISLETFAEPDGTLLGHRARVTVDNGAYNHYGPSVMGACCSILSSLHRSRFVEIDADLVYTNLPPGGQFRGYGAPQATFAVESQMDELADALGLDPIELRRRNALATGDVTHAGWRIVDGNLDECLRTLREKSDWDRKRQDGGRGRGIGMAIGVHVSGSKSYEGSHRSEAWVTLSADGEVEASFGSGDAGTGQRTVIAQVVAEELGLPPDQVAVRMMDSDQAPDDFGAWSSRGTMMSGHPSRQAAAAAAVRLRELAAEKFGVDPSEVTLAGGRATAGEDAVDIGSLVTLSEENRLDGRLLFAGTYDAGTELVDPDGSPRNISPTYSFAAQAVEVDVDLGTGEIKIVNVTAVHDSGLPINPVDFEGQVIGGVNMGLGAALGEEVIHEGGKAVNPSYLNYAMLRAADSPHVDVIPVIGNDPAGPHGAKGLGEIVLNPTAAAVANAVAHATGVRVRDLPITPDKVLKGLRAAEPRRRVSPLALWRRPDRWWIAVMRWLYPRGLHHLLHRYGTRLARMRAPVSDVPSVERPARLDEAVAMLSRDPHATAVGGVTDVMPARVQGLERSRRLIDVTGIPELRTIETRADGGVSIGAGVRLTELLDQALLEDFPAIRQATSTIASEQIRNVATVGGNLCQQKRCWFFRNDFPCYKRAGATAPCYAVLGDHRFHHAVLGAHRCQAVTPSDLATVLASLDAQLEIAGPDGRRRSSIVGFFTGPGETSLRSGECIVSVELPPGARSRLSSFEKLALWEGDFAVVSAAVALEVSDGHVADVKVILGGIAPKPYRAMRSEQALRGQALTKLPLDVASTAWAVDAHPLENNGWKIDAGASVLRRCIEQATAQLDDR